MNGALVQSQIWFGYSEAARFLGSDYQFTRPSPGNLLKLNDGSGNTLLEGGGNILLEGSVSFPGDPLFTRCVSLNAEDMKYGKPNKYGKATWYALMDGTGLQVGDYFVGEEGTFFIAAMQLLLPILVVECNRVIAILRPQAQEGAGVQTYGGVTTANQQALVGGVPCSILQGTKGEKSESALPGDTRASWWTILLPTSLPRVIPDDIIIDDLGQRYIVSSPEQTGLGWRVTAMMAIA